MTGLSCARVLRRAGAYVEVFEQERVIGGRIATARIGTTAYDHGSPCLSARGDRFQAYLKELTDTGYAARWNPRIHQTSEGGSQVLPWYVGLPGMANAVRPLAESVRITTSRRVHTLKRQERGWHIWFEDQTSAGPFSAVGVTVPPTEARLLVGGIESLADKLDGARMAPTWSLMVRLQDPVFSDFDVVSDMSQTVRWIARNSSKPGRNPRNEAIVIHASQGWSRETEDIDPAEVSQELWTEVTRILGLPNVVPVEMHAHLWRNGLVDAALGES